MVNWKPEGRKKRGRPRRNWKDGIYTAMGGRDVRWANGTMEGDGIWKSEGVARRFKTAQCIYIYIICESWMLIRVIFLMMETELISETSFDLGNLKRL